MDDLGAKIKAKRIELGLKQYQLAKLTGVSAPTMNDWEQGRTSPRGKNLINLAAALKTTPATFYLSDNESNNELSPEIYDLVMQAVSLGLGDKLTSYVKYLVSEATAKE
jgi:transcriptional regulator with XRE-family HTH domain